MQTLTEVDKFFGEELRRRRAQAHSGKRQPGSFVESVVSNAITRAARAYMDGLSFCSFNYQTHNEVQASPEVVSEIRQQIAELFGAENIKVDDCDPETGNSIFIFIGFPRTG